MLLSHLQSQQAAITRLTEEREEILLKDRAKTREINILTKEVRADDLDRRGKTTKKRRIRPVGLLRPEHHDFILFGAGEEEINGRYIPPRAMDDALKRFRDYQLGKGTIYELD